MQKRSKFMIIPLLIILIIIFSYILIENNERYKIEQYLYSIYSEIIN